MICGKMWDVDGCSTSLQTFHSDLSNRTVTMGLYGVHQLAGAQQAMAQGHDPFAVLQPDNATIDTLE